MTTIEIIRDGNDAAHITLDGKSYSAVVGYISNERTGDGSRTVEVFNAIRSRDFKTSAGAARFARKSMSRAG